MSEQLHSRHGGSDSNADLKRQFTMETQVGFSTLESWFSCFPVDGQGIPTSDAAHALVVRLFEDPQETHSVQRLSEELFLPKELVETMCEQLRTAFVLKQEAKDGGQYRVSDDSRNLQLRRKIERVLASPEGWMINRSRPCMPPE